MEFKECTITYNEWAVKLHNGSVLRFDELEGKEFCEWFEFYYPNSLSKTLENGKLVIQVI